MSNQPMSTTVKRLYLIQVATLPPYHAPVVCYLIQTTDGKNILVDSGLPPNVQPPPGMQPPIMGKYVTEQLAEIGLKPEDIQIFVVTHLDPDHAGNNEKFQAAEFVIQRKMFEGAQTSPRAARSRDHWDNPALRYRQIDGDTTLVPGVDLIATDGHALGHQSVLVRLPETGTVLLAIDAVGQSEGFVPNRQRGPMDEDEVALIASTRKLIDLTQREQAALVVFGHDGAQWQTLRKLPEFYS